MNRKLFALLIGIDEYPEGVPSLKGCINDVNDARDFLENYFNHCDLHIKTLKNNRATRAGIIKQFRSHLCNAGPNDVAFFYFSGHGSRLKAPKEFLEYEPDGKHESIVGHDSRKKDGLDIADKELAVLFSEVASNHPHILAVMDCCHSGSGIRDVQDPGLLKARFTGESPSNRSLESYLNGYFIQNGIKIPKTKMVLMAACDKTERAFEDTNHRGVFTYRLFKTLRELGGKISYADLFLKTRSAVRIHTPYQNPQLEVYERFNVYGMFLDGRVDPNSHGYRIYKKNNSWFINCGAIHGIPDDPLKRIDVVVYEPLKEKSAEETEIHGSITNLGMQESEIAMEEGGLLERKREYKADIVALPVPALNIALAGEIEGINKIRDSVAQLKCPVIEFVEPSIPTIYEVRCGEGYFRIMDRRTCRIVSSLSQNTDNNEQILLSQLARIERWERMLRLKNPKTALNPAEVEFLFYKVEGNGNESRYNDNEITLDYSVQDAGRGGIPFVVKVKNNSIRNLFFTLLYLSPGFGIYTFLPCQRIPYSEREIILDDVHALNIPDESYGEVFDTFLLVVSTEHIDDYLFVQEEIGKDHDLRQAVARGKIRGDWFTRSITVKTVRQANGVA